MNDSSSNHKRTYLARRTPCWLCSRQLQRMKSGAHRGRYCAVEYTDEQGLTRYAHVFCYHTQNVLDHDAEFKDDGDEALA